MNSVLTSNNYKVNSVFGDKKIGKPNFNLFYGIELEYEVVTPLDILKQAELNHDYSEKYAIREKAGTIVHPYISKFAILKHDGSGKNMFEVVTVPMSLDRHIEYWNPFFDNIKDFPITVEKTCGMHVHASRSTLTPFQIGKMLIFIYSIKNLPFITRIAGRVPPPKFAEIAPKKLGDATKHKLRKSALNLNGAETIEFRFFKSTLTKMVMLKNIEFCDALIRFTWPGVIGYDAFKKHGIKLFCEYIKENKDLYPNLHEFLIKLRYNKVRKRTRPRRYKSTIDGFMPPLIFDEEVLFSNKAKTRPSWIL